jgi:hypothetical protein
MDIRFSIAGYGNIKNLSVNNIGSFDFSPADNGER